MRTLPLGRSGSARPTPPRLQIVAVEQLLASPAPPIRIPMARSDTYRKAAMEERSGRQGALDLRGRGVPAESKMA